MGYSVQPHQIIGGSADLESVGAASSSLRATGYHPGSLIQGGNEINQELLKNINTAVQRQHKLDKNIVLETLHDGGLQGMTIRDIG